MERSPAPSDAPTDPASPVAAADLARQPQRRTRLFAMLLATTATTFVVQGTVPPSDGQQVAVTALVGLSLLLAVLAGGFPPRLIRIVLVATVVGFVLSVLHAVTDQIGDGTVRAMNAALIVVAPPAVAIGVIREIRTSGQVRVPAVMGVLALYLLIGMFFGFVYGAIDRLGGAPFFAEDEPVTSSSTLYFSFTTLTTVGFGDLTARSDVGRTLAASEALVGQVYLVTVVAAIVGNLRRPAQRDRAS